VILLASEEPVGSEELHLTQEEKTAVTDIASASFDSAMRFIVKAVVTWLIAIFFMFGAALGVIYLKVDSIDTTVTSHNTELSQTLTAACVLIKSDPKLPLPAGCVPALKNVTVPTNAGS
jgi:hypothetical protein